MKVKICMMTPVYKEVEISDAVIEAWENDELPAWSTSAEPNLYSLIKNKLGDNTGELVWAENAETGETLCEW